MPLYTCVQCFQIDEVDALPADRINPYIDAGLCVAGAMRLLLRLPLNSFVLFIHISYPFAG